MRRGECERGRNPHGSYYRLGVGGRTGQTKTAPGTAPRPTLRWSARSDAETPNPPPHQQATDPPSPVPPPPTPSPGPDPDRQAPARLRTVHETSAGGLVIDGIDGPKDGQVAALIGRLDRRGRMLWSLPKGHIELGETAEQTAIREVAEETGIQGSVLAALGSIDYWFVTEGRRVHKTVHHYLMRFLGGELSDEDVEVSEVAWVPLRELPVAAGLRRRAPPRRGRRRAHRQAARRRPRLRCRRCRTRRRGAAPRRTRTPGTVVPTSSAQPQPGRRANGCGQGP